MENKYVKHPIIIGNYTVITPMIVRLIENIKGWISKRTPGAIIYGAPRIGKTQGMKFAMNYYAEKENIPHYYYSAISDNTPSLARFATGLLFAVDHPNYSKGGNAQLKLLQVVQQITTEVAMTEQNRIMLVIDEAHNLTVQQYGWLIKIYNELKIKGIEMMTLLVGQNELKANRENYIAMGQLQIVGRFMTDTFDFHGLRPKSKDIEFLLSVYDKQTEFPSGSGVSYTENFYKQAFHLSDFSLEKHSKDLYKAIQYVHDDYGLGNINELPLNNFIPIIEYVLVEFGEEGQNTDELTVDHWKEALIETHYVQSHIVLN